MGHGYGNPSHPNITWLNAHQDGLPAGHQHSQD